jgi:tetratricopeptide (TPR) repeat protein/transcriptional regulator with XRE-family HTH domain
MTTVHTLTFAALLKRQRLASGLTQAELAARAGLSPEAISALERGVNRSPRRDTVTLLADALGLQGQERAQLEAAARQRPQASVAPSPSPHAEKLPPLAGRAREVRLIESLLAGTLPPVLLFAGEPGVGKTRLLRQAADTAAAAGWTVLMGGCQRASGQDPYAPLLGLIEHHVATRPDAGLRADLQGCGWLVRLLPELAELAERGLVDLPAWTLAPDQERRLMFAAAARFLENVAGPAGTLLVLDDLQWAGADACDLLAAFVHTPGPTSVRVVGAYRDSEVPPDSPPAGMIGELVRMGRLHQSALHRLTEEESAALLRALLQDAAALDAGAEQRMLRRSSGIPFYLVSWAQALRSGTADASADETLPWDVLQSVRQRVAAQPEVAREALQVLAVAGGKAALGLLRAVLAQGGRGEDELVAGLEVAYQARLLDEAGDDAYQFAHDLIREVVALDLSAARRTTLHRRIAEALEREPGEAPAEMLAFHYTHGGEPVKALAYLERAGDRAIAMRAHVAAETAYRELVERLDRLGRPLDAARAREKWGAVLSTLSRYDEALAAFERALDVYRGEGDVEAHAQALVQIGQVHADRGAARQGLQRLAPVLASGDARGISPRTLASLHDLYAQLLHVGGQYREQLEEAERAAGYARAAQDEPLLCQIEMRRGNALRMLGRMREASQVLEGVIRTAESIGDPRILSFALENVSVVYLLQGEFARSARYVERALELSEQLGDPLVSELLVLRRGMSAYATGEWEPAREDFVRAREMTQQLGISWVSAYTALGLGQLRLAQGEVEAASQLLDEAVALAAQAGDLQALRWAQTALAERDLLAGEPEAARDRLEPLLDRPGQQEGLVTYLLPYLAWASFALGDDERAERQVQECLARATDEQIRLAQTDALRVQALYAIRQGRLEAAAQALAAGLTLSREMPYPYAEAKLLFAAALLANARHDPERERTLLNQARDALRALGEGLYLPHVERTLADLPRGV